MAKRINKDRYMLLINYVRQSTIVDDETKNNIIGYITDLKIDQTIASAVTDKLMGIREEYTTEAMLKSTNINNEGCKLRIADEYIKSFVNDCDDIKLLRNVCKKATLVYNATGLKKLSNAIDQYLIDNNIKGGVASLQRHLLNQFGLIISDYFAYKYLAKFFDCNKSIETTFDLDKLNELFDKLDNIEDINSYFRRTLLAKTKHGKPIKVITEINTSQNKDKESNNIVTTEIKTSSLIKVDRQNEDNNANQFGNKPGHVNLVFTGLSSGEKNTKMVYEIDSTIDKIGTTLINFNTFKNMLNLIDSGLIEIKSVCVNISQQSKIIIDDIQQIMDVVRSLEFSMTKSVNWTPEFINKFNRSYQIEVLKQYISMCDRNLTYHNIKMMLDYVKSNPTVVKNLQ